jgi:hypothetical protein
MSYRDDQDPIFQQIEQQRQAAIQAAEWRELQNLVQAGVSWKDADEVYRCWREVARLDGQTLWQAGTTARAQLRAWIGATKTS